jgi:hypothetical protein
MTIYVQYDAFRDSNNLGKREVQLRGKEREYSIVCPFSKVA